MIESYLWWFNRQRFQPLKHSLRTHNTIKPLYPGQYFSLIWCNRHNAYVSFHLLHHLQHHLSSICSTATLSSWLATNLVADGVLNQRCKKIRESRLLILGLGLYAIVGGILGFLEKNATHSGVRDLPPVPIAVLTTLLLCSFLLTFFGAIQTMGANFGATKFRQQLKVTLVGFLKEAIIPLAIVLIAGIILLCIHFYNLTLPF